MERTRASPSARRASRVRETTAGSSCEATCHHADQDQRAGQQDAGVDQKPRGQGVTSSRSPARRDVAVHDESTRPEAGTDSAVPKPRYHFPPAHPAVVISAAARAARQPRIRTATSTQRKPGATRPLVVDRSIDPVLGSWFLTTRAQPPFVGGGGSRRGIGSISGVD